MFLMRMVMQDNKPTTTVPVLLRTTISWFLRGLRLLMLW